MTALPHALPHALIVAGPTCSGKSALALALAERLGGVVINADSMQVYRELRIVTARPTAQEEARVPHALYGIRAAAEPGNVAWWRKAALAAMAAARGLGRIPILCGGTGLYFASLVDGISEIPECGEPARAEARWLLAEHGPTALHAALAKVDPATAARLRPSDSQRVARAWEVWRGTGRGLVAWQCHKGVPAPWRFSAILLDPPREVLRAAIAGRFGAMLAAGALDEVRALLALGLDAAVPALRAHGVPELSAHLRGELALDAAARRAEVVTGQYTKRQATWFRHKRMADPARTHMIHARIGDFEQFSESSKPFVAAVEGWVAGAAVGLAIGCDTVIAAQSARFVTPFVRIGLIPDYGLLHTLPRRIGEGRARNMFLSTDPIDAAEALRIGLVDQVVPDGTALDHALARAKKLAEGAPQAIAMIRAILARGLAEALEWERTAQAALFLTADHAEGKAAFLAKRKPVFKGV